MDSLNMGEWMSTEPSHLNRGLGALRSYKLTASAGALMLALSVYGLVLLLEGDFWTSFFGAQSSSVVFFSLVFLGVGTLLARRRVPDMETFSIALSTTLSTIWLYEFIYHYSFISYFNYFRYPYFDFNDTNTFLLEGAASLLILVGYKHIRVKGNYYFGLSILLFSLLYAGWLLIGFPQYDGTFQLPRFIQVGDPFFLGSLLNRLSKLLLCLSWVSLYLGRR
jgi:hypothetical protein